MHKDMLKGLAPAKAIRSVKSRGLKNSLYHVARRLGTARERAFTGPELVRINPMGYVCNHTCPMCWLQHLDPEELKREKKNDRENNLKLADYEAFFDSMPPGVREINIVGGGEPLIHPDIAGIMRSIKKHRWTGTLITNGSLLKAELADAFLDMRWDSVRVSVHAGDKDTYQAIQGVDRYDAMHKNLSYFDKRRRELGLREQCGLYVFHVIQRENIPTIPLLFKVAEEVGADAIEFDPVIPYDANMWLTAEEIRSAHDALSAAAEKCTLPTNIHEILGQLRVEENCAAEHKPFVPAKRCSVGFDQSFITASGDVLPCCFSNEILGNVRESSFHDIWYGDKYAKFRARLIHGKFAKYCITNRCTLPGVLHN